MRRVSALVLVLALVACATHRQELNRAQRFYDDSEYEQALALFRVLERDLLALEATDRTRYAYLRGMTDYRLGFRADARHWLALAKAMEQQRPGGLHEAWAGRLEDALADLNRDVFGGAEPFADPRAPDHPADGDGAEPPAEPSGRSGACKVITDCIPGQLCQSGKCVDP